MVYTDVESYIGSFPKDIQLVLRELRSIVKTNAPQAEERLSYQMPSYHYRGRLAYFAAWKNHIGFYGVPANILKMFEDELKSYKQSKGTIQFPFSQPLPTNLIKRIVLAQVAENEKN